MQNIDIEQDENEMVQQAQHDHPPTPENLPNRTQESAESDFTETDEASTSTDKPSKRDAPDNSGSMFKNDRKSKDSHPDISGSALVNGIEYYVSGWRKSGAKGDFYSLSFKPKAAAAAAASDLI